jgi:adenylate cyclase
MGCRRKTPEAKRPRQTRAAGANTCVLECKGSAGEGESRSRLYAIRLAPDDPEQAWPIAALALAGPAPASVVSRPGQGQRMSDVFISYARSTESEAARFAEALRAAGFSVWRDDELPAHRAYMDVIEERLRASKAVLVVWSAEGVKSQWVRAEADVARLAGTLVQLSLDGAALPLPFNQIQCADLVGWTGDAAAPGWRKVLGSIAELVGSAPTAPAPQPAATAPPARPSKPSIAVLPFANLSGDPDQEYFADGMVEEIATALARFKSIFVVASGSSLTFKNRAVSPQEAARSLGVRYVLEGSVRKAGARVRISAKLIDGDTGAQLWAERFDDTLDDLFELQDKVALSVAGAIEPAVRESEIRSAAERPTESATSYDLYLRALPLYRAHDGPQNARAIELLTRAIELDPDYGAALSLAASSHSRAFGFAWDDEPQMHRQLGVELARRALRVAGDDPDVLVRAASVISQDTTDDVSAFFERAIALNPASSVAHVIIANYQLRFGEPALAQHHLETSMRLDPLSPLRATQRGMLGTAIFLQRRFAEAIGPLKESAQLNVTQPQSHAMVAICLSHLGEIEEGKQALERMRAISRLSPSQLGALMFARPGYWELFRDGLRRLGEAMPDEAPATI